MQVPWNDVEPEDNALTDEPAKVPEHVDNYTSTFSPGSPAGRSSKEDLILMSERVYNFQRVFNLRMGFGPREHDAIPYRSAGPVTAEEYESRAGALRRAVAREAGHRPRRDDARRKKGHAARLSRGPVRAADRRGLQAPRLDAGRRAHHRQAAGTGHRLSRRGRGGQAISERSVAIMLELADERAITVHPLFCLGEMTPESTVAGCRV